MAPAMYVWYYNVGDNEYLPFPDEASDKMEGSYTDWLGQGSPQHPVDLKSGKYTYKIHFHNMRQTNVVTQRTRKLERREARLSQDLHQKDSELQDLRVRLQMQAGEGLTCWKTDLSETKKKLQNVQAALQEKEEAAKRHADSVRYWQDRALNAEGDKQRLQKETSDHLRRTDDLQDTVKRLDASAKSKAHELTLLSKEVEKLRAVERQLPVLQASLKEKEAAVTAKDEEVMALKARIDEQRTASGPTGTAPHVDWQFTNHMGDLQSYVASQNDELEQHYSEWCNSGMPAHREYQLTDRYIINFSEMWQENVKHGSGRRRPIQRNLSMSVDERLKEALHKKDEKIEELEQVFESKNALFKQRVQTVMDQLKEKQQETQELTAKLQEKGAMVAKLQRDAKAKDQEMQTSNGRLKAAESQLTDFNDHKQAQEALVQSHENKIKKLQKELKGYEESDMKEEIVKLQISLREAVAQVKMKEEVICKLQNEQRMNSMFKDGTNPLAKDVEALESEVAKVQRKATAAFDEGRAAAAAELKRASEENTRLTKELKDSKENAKEQQNRLKKEVQKSEKELRKAREHSSNLVAATLTREWRSFLQENLLMEVPERDEETLRQTEAGLIDGASRRMLEQSAQSRSRALALGPEMLQVFGELPEPGPDGQVREEEVALAHDSPDFHFIKDMVLRSLVSHRLTYHSEEWCEPPRLHVVSVTLLPWTEKQVKLYSKERERILRRELTEVPFPLEGAPRPMVAKDANEFFLFHGCPWEAVPTICAQGFDWKFRGTNQGCMFGQGTYFAPNASKCDMYADKDENGHKCMLLARVLLGACVPRWRKCTDVKNLPKGFDSICAATRDNGGSVDHPEVCIFQKLQALPAFKIEYKHDDECKCNLCRREDGDR